LPERGGSYSSPVAAQFAVVRTDGCTRVWPALRGFQIVAVAAKAAGQAAVETAAAYSDGFAVARSEAAADAAVPNVAVVAGVAIAGSATVMKTVAPTAAVFPCCSERLWRREQEKRARLQQPLRQPTATLRELTSRSLFCSQSPPKFLSQRGVFHPASVAVVIGVRQSFESIQHLSIVVHHLQVVHDGCIGRMRWRHPVT